MSLPTPISDLRKRPLMFLHKNDYVSNATFILGADVATKGALLRGFRTWLDESHPVAKNMVWYSRILYVAFPGVSSPWHLIDQGDIAANQNAIETLYDCLERFFATKQSPNVTYEGLDSASLF